MGKKSPKKGSRAFWHRKRAPKLVSRVRSWPSGANAGKGLLGFAAFKAGMTHVLMIDDTESPTKGQEVTHAATILEVPPLFVYAIVAYESTPYGLKAFAQITATNAPKAFSEVLPLAKKTGKTIEEVEKSISRASEVRVLAFTQPEKTGFASKKSKPLEIGVGGANAAEKFAVAREFLGKEVGFSQVFSEGDFVDVIAVTKGKGWQGVVKRFGIALNPRKATKSRRHGGSIGGERQAKVFYTVPRAGQTGFHRRTDFNKRILKISKDASEVSLTGAVSHYGKLRCEFILLEGSVPGSSKRIIRLRKPLFKRVSRKPELKEIVKHQS
ncbi:50S ribosomal protein L3 [Candidatus Micrarchaeota archaeon]|nr:50S ribosomal protein L3 [Candidatus Micrarchaeota archaeon]